jgi:PAS domain S-box-containing protein
MHSVRAQEKFSKAFQASPDAILITRLADGSFIDVNDSFESMSGYRREEIVNGTTRSMDMWVNPDDRALLITAIENHTRVSSEEYDFRMKSEKYSVACIRLKSSRSMGNVVSS